MKFPIFIILLATATLGPFLKASARDITLLNASYDPTRELYAEYDDAFIKYWKQKTGDNVQVDLSNGASGKQARAILDGLDADVATLALAYDVDSLADKGGLIPQNWQSRLPNNSSPYTSTVVFLVRKGNPKGIRDWGDLVRDGVSIITPNPKVSGVARWNFLAAWAWALKNLGDQNKAKDFLTDLYKHAPVLDSGARAAAMTFTKRGIGDVLLDWENEALLSLKENPGQFEIVTPSLSILAEPPVTVVDTYADKHGTRDVATEYLKYLYSPEAQEIIAKNFYRPIDPEVQKKYESQFPKLKLVTVDDIFGGWRKAQSALFDDGGVFDQIYRPAGAR